MSHRLLNGPRMLALGGVWLFLWLPQPGSAQALEPRHRTVPRLIDQTLDRRIPLSAVPLGATVRLHWNQAPALVARLTHLGQDSLDLVQACPISGCAGISPRDLRVPLRDLSAVEYRAGTRARQGFLIGLGSGVALAALLILPQRDSEDFTKTEAFPIVAVILGGAGGLVGAALGSTNRVWVNVALPTLRTP